MPLSKKVTVEQLQWIASRAERTDRMPQRFKQIIVLAASRPWPPGEGTNGVNKLVG